MFAVWTYPFYLVISVAMTIWVARTLYHNGRVFILDAVHGNETLADSINHLLIVGFYLINIGYVTLSLRYGDKPASLQEAIEFLSFKVGLVLVILGVMHFANLAMLSKIRHRAQLHAHGGAAPVAASAPFDSAAPNDSGPTLTRLKSSRE